MNRKDDEDFHQQLSEHGFHHMAQWPGMYIEIKDQEYPSLPDSLELGMSSNAGELEEWRILVNQYLMKTTPFSTSFIQKCKEQVASLIFYGLKVDGKIVTTAMAFPKGKITGLYMFCTDEQHRRQGYTSLVMQQILADLKQMGQKYACLQASADGKWVYTKLGFIPICNFDIYWQLGVR